MQRRTPMHTIALLLALSGVDAFAVSAGDLYKHSTTAATEIDGKELQEGRIAFTPCYGGKFGCESCWSDYEKTESEKFKEGFCTCMKAFGRDKLDLASISAEYGKTCTDAAKKVEEKPAKVVKVTELSKKAGVEKSAKTIRGAMKGCDEDTPAGHPLCPNSPLPGGGGGGPGVNPH